MGNIPTIQSVEAAKLNALHIYIQYDVDMVNVLLDEIPPPPALPLLNLPCDAGEATNTEGKAPGEPRGAISILLFSISIQNILFKIRNFILFPLK